MATRDFYQMTSARTSYTWDEAIALIKYRNKNVTNTPIYWVYADTNIPVVIGCSDSY